MNQAERKFHRKQRELRSKRNHPDIKDKYHHLQHQLESEYFFYVKGLHREYQLRHRLGFFNEEEAMFISPEEKMRTAYKLRKEAEMKAKAESEKALNLNKTLKDERTTTHLHDSFAV